MRKIVILACALVGAFGFSAFADITKTLKASSGPIEPGEWNVNLSAGREYARAHNLPLVYFFGKTACGNCAGYANACADSPEFINWRKEHGLVMICVEDPCTNLSKDEVTFARTPSRLSNPPLIKIWWPKKEKDGKVTEKSTNFEAIVAPYRSDPSTKAGNVMASIDHYLDLWGWTAVEPEVPMSAGEFADGDTEFDRLEAEDGTGSVTVRLYRDEVKAKVATNATVRVFGPTGTELAQTGCKVAWAEGQTNATVTVDLSKAGFTEAGQKVTLVIRSAAGDESKTNHITYVVKGNSASNPDFSGCASFGRWTMDFNAATQKVAATAGAYTLVSVQGALWCPDCANTERNFLDLEDGSGANRFAKWATERKIALVSVDIPNYGSKNPTPTLLSRAAYETKLVRNTATEYPAISGGDPELTNAVPRSGLGYLSRKGVSDKLAGKTLDLNHFLASTNTTFGGFHRPEDGNKDRTGVPIFVLLRRDGTAVGRITLFASKSPMLADRAHYDSYVKRIEELIAMDSDRSEIENNDARTTVRTIDYAGGVVSTDNLLSHADDRDTFRIAKTTGGVAIKVLANGPASAPVKLIVQERTVSGSVADLVTASGNLADGVSVEAQLGGTSGGYFIQLKADTASAEFNATNAESTVRSYALTSVAVLMPDEKAASAKAPDATAEMAIRATSNAVYRLIGFDTSSFGGRFEKVQPGDGDYGDGNNWRSIRTGDVSVKASAPGAVVTFQRWVPGKVCFKLRSRTVDEGPARTTTDVEIPVWRIDGMSGDVTVRVHLATEEEDPRAVTKDTSGNKRYVDFDPVLLTWKDGELGVTNLIFTIKGDSRYDRDGKFIFKMERISGYATVPANEEFILTVREDDIQSPGRVKFADAEPYFARPLTVYVKEGEDAVLYVDRYEATDGDVSVSVSTTGGEIVGDTRLSWRSHCPDSEIRKTVRLRGLEAGQSADVTLSNPSGGLVVTSAAKTVRVICVGGPQFKKVEQDPLWYYCHTLASVCLIGGAHGGVESYYSYEVDPESLLGGEVSFVMVSGTLPAGLQLVWAGGPNALLSVMGVPTKAGYYEAVYRIDETYGGVLYKGMTTKMAFIVLDPAAALKLPDGTEIPPVNPAVAVTRSFTAVPVVDGESKRLVGTVSLTIPSNGRVTAKYVNREGTTVFAAPCWDDLDEEDYDLGATLVPVSEGAVDRGYGMTVIAHANGGIGIQINDPEFEMALSTEIAGTAEDAAAWEGYYTAALPVTNVSEKTSGIAPAGCGFLTFRMQGEGAVAARRVTWAGFLPNGTAVSGSSSLLADGGFARVPFMMSSSRDTFGGIARIAANAFATRSQNRRVITAPGSCYPYWQHREIPAAGADFTVRTGLHGSIYDVSEALASCCEIYESKQMAFFARAAGIAPVNVTVKENTIEVSSTNPNKLKLTLARNTGVLNGTFAYVDGTENKVAQWHGVVLVGWGEDCGCGIGEDPVEKDIVLPFVSGFWLRSLRLPYELGGVRRELGIRTGDWAGIDVK